MNNNCQLILVLFFSKIFIGIFCAKGADSPLEKDENVVPNDDKKSSPASPSKTTAAAEQIDVNEKKELLKKEIENLKNAMDKRTKLIMAEKLPSLVVELNEIAKKIVNTDTLVDKKFIHQLIDVVRPIYVATIKDHLLLLAKLRMLLNDQKIKNDVKKFGEMTAVREQVNSLYSCFDTELKKMGAYRKDRMELEHHLERHEGNETLEEFDRKFVDSLRLNLEECRDFIITLLALAEKQMDLLVMSNEEKQKQSIKKEEYMSFYN